MPGFASFSSITFFADDARYFYMIFTRLCFATEDIEIIFIVEFYLGDEF